MTLKLNQIRVDFLSFLILAWQGFHFLSNFHFIFSKILSNLYVKIKECMNLEIKFYNQNK